MRTCTKLAFCCQLSPEGMSNARRGIQSCSDPSWVSKDLRRRGLTQPRDTAHAFVAILKACTKNRDLRCGTRVHNDLLRRGLLEQCSDALVTMYAKCGALAQAEALFDMHKSMDVFTWTSLMAAYAHRSLGHKALHYFEQMTSKGLPPDAVTLTCVLKACGSIGALDKGEKIHDEIMKQGLLGSNVELGNALVDMYARCRDLMKAQSVLEELPVRDAISYTSLIAGYTQVGKGQRALECFEHMQREGLSPDGVTLSCLLKACGIVGALDKGEEIHDQTAKHGLLHNDIVLGTAVVDMYIKCGALAKARRVLEDLPRQNVICWTALITGYAEHNRGEEALECLEAMQSKGFSPDAVTFLSILKACSTIGATDKGQTFHEEIAKQGLLGNDILLGTAVVDMYAKCGALSRARQVLEELPLRDVISWNAIITGYSQQGKVKEALDCLEQMQCESFSPNAGICSSVVAACSRVGLIDTAQRYLEIISKTYGIKLDVEHCCSLVDVFGRAGHLDRAVEVMKKLPSPSRGIWCTLFGASRESGNASVGRWAFQHAVQVGQS